VRWLRVISAIAAGAFLCLSAHAQFKEDAFSQSYADPSDTTARDTTDRFFSFKEFADGLTHKRSVKLGTMFMGSTIAIGGMQIYNRDYWKLPLVYGGIGAGVGLGIHYNNLYKADPVANADYKTWRNIAFAGAAAFWWGSLMDGAVSYKSGQYPYPPRSTVYSLLLPGLGQIYNGEYWKLPIYWGGLAACYYFVSTNNRSYQRYRTIYRQATDEESTVTPPISAETAKYYRDAYRRLRDYSILALAGVYFLQVIDANVFAFMQDFEVSDDISLRVSPTVITPDYAQNPAMGFSLGLTF
jgi:hypothetical protein